MKVELRLEDDTDLRQYIKDLVRGQILAITREEFLGIIREELSRKIAGTTDSVIRNLFVAIATTEAQKVIKNMDAQKIAKDLFHPLVESTLMRVIMDKDWQSVIDTVAIEKIKKMIK